MYVLAIGGLLLLIAAGIALWKIAASGQRPYARPNESEPGLPFENVSFASGGTKLQGWYIPSSSPHVANSPAVIIAHGWRSNRSRVLRYAGPLHEAGYALFLYDAAGHGSSEAIAISSAFRFRDDLLTAAAAAASLPGVDPERMAVLGHSLGGYAAVLAMQSGLPVRAVVADSAPFTLGAMVASNLRSRRLPFFPLGYLIPFVWLLRSGIAAADAAASNLAAVLRANAAAGERGVPVLLAHSHGDTVVAGDSLRQAESKRLGNMQSLWLNTDGHSCSEQDPKFWQAVLPFLHKHL